MPPEPARRMRALQSCSGWTGVSRFGHYRGMRTSHGNAADLLAFSCVLMRPRSSVRERLRSWVPLLALLMVLTAGAAFGQTPTSRPPTEVPGLAYTNAFFPAADHDLALPTPEGLLSFPLGSRAANAAEIERCLRAWTNAVPNRTRLVEYARSHEGRPLHYLVLTSERNHGRLEAIQSGLARAGAPRDLPEAEAMRLVGSLPAVAWLGYCIHGDETEGPDLPQHHGPREQKGDLQIEQDEQDGHEVIAHVELHARIFEGLEAALVGRELFTVGTMGPGEPADAAREQDGNHADTYADEDEQQDREVLR